MARPIFSSMLVRLTLWYTVILALVLTIFSLVTFLQISRSARQRTDESLADTANSFITNFNIEMVDEHQTPMNALREATGGFHFRDRQVVVFDEKRNVIMSSAAPERIPDASTWLTSTANQSPLSKLLNTASESGVSAYENSRVNEEPVRVSATPVSAGSERYVIVIVYSLHDQLTSLAQARNTFLLAIPLALLLASAGGYFLARKSLAPVVTMGEQAAQIGASNLDERIPVPPNDELGRLARIFNDLLSRLDHSFTQQKRFMADASHELRTPVAVICGESEVTLSQPQRDENEYRESLAIVNDEGRRLTRMVEDLFTMARAETGEYPLQLTNFYLDESLNECIRSVRSLAVQKGIDLHYETLSSEIPFHGDESLVRRMVLNVLQNAIKYTASEGQVSVRLTKNGDHCEVIVSDTGVGIPAEAQPLVFDRFFRVDKARSRGESLNGSGAGLGLSIAKWAAEQHGGAIVLNHSDSSGSRFVILLPITMNER